MDRNSIYQQKYLKYKSKYTELKKNGLKGGAIPKIINKGIYMSNLKGGATIELVSNTVDIPSITGHPVRVLELDDYEQKLTEVRDLLSTYKKHVQSTSEPAEPVKLAELDNKLKVLAIHRGVNLYTRWIDARKPLIDKILSNFDAEGNLLPGANSALNSATWFNDLYKWTMLRIMIFIVEQAKFAGSPVMVKFQVDIRESSVRDAIINPANEDLRETIIAALNGLTTREFSRSVFENVNRSKGGILTTEDIDKVCGPVQSPRTLVQRVYTNRSGPLLDDGVVVRFYKDERLTYDLPEFDANGEPIPPKPRMDKSGNLIEPGLTIIEAEGPWHLVTWLETSMMQAVYEAYHKWNLKKKAETKVDLENAQKEGVPEEERKEAIKVQTAKEYKTWLSTALLRCACSVAYTQILQSMGDPIPALFTGRRTGGLPFLILQNLFFIDHFKQAMGLAAPVSTRGLFSDEGTPCLGTSSVDAQQYLDMLTLIKTDPTEKLPLPQKTLLSTAGTHAHELSMVLSVLYHELDVNEHKLPFSQVLGHYLYKELVLPKTLGPLPMLPDTLGTPSFVAAASLLVDGAKTFLGHVKSGRQDSGNMVDFKNVMRLIMYEAGCMASEIEDTLTLLQAFFLEYNTFGAGGFFGDSNKAWDSKGTNISMAVKVVRVMCHFAPGTALADFKGKPFPHIKVEGNICTGYPIKTGDAKDMNDPKEIMSMSKFSVDKTLPATTINDMKVWAIERRANGYKTLMDPTELQKLQALQALKLPLSSIIVVNQEKTTLTINSFPDTLALVGGYKKLLLKRK
jgi:nicotinic acid phosphoribosyltransferase